MTASAMTGKSCEQPTSDDAKVRQCLRCQAAFHSEWAGERVCARCKNTAGWREGVPARSRPLGGRRS